jgi:hypothetical protein
MVRGLLKSQQAGMDKSATIGATTKVTTTAGSAKSPAAANLHIDIVFWKYYYYYYYLFLGMLLSRSLLTMSFATVE